MPAEIIVDGEFQAFWSDEDDAWVGICTGYPFVSHVGAADGPAALAGIKAVMADVTQCLRDSEAEARLDP